MRDSTENPPLAASQTPGKTRALKTTARPGKLRSGIFSSEKVLTALFLVFLLGLIGSLAYLAYRNDSQTVYVSQSSRLVMLTQRIAGDSHNAIIGEETAFQKLENSRLEFTETLENLEESIGNSGLKMVPDNLQYALHRVVKNWSDLDKRIEQILQEKNALLQTRTHIAEVNDTSPELVGRIDELVELLLTADTDRALIKSASRLGMLGQRIIKNANLVLPGGVQAVDAVSLLSGDITSFENTVKEIQSKTGKELKSRLDRLQETFNQLLDHIRNILQSGQKILVAQNADKAIDNSSDALVYQLVDLKNGYAAMNKQTMFNYLPWALALAALLSLLRLTRVRLSREALKVDKQEEENRSTQQSIMTLLDQMSALADGDLSIKPEVNDSVTGAIADAVSYAVQEMRYLVARIQQAAKQITSTSDQSQGIAEDLSHKASQQANQIVDAAERIQEIARSMESMSSGAKQSADVALQSVAVAKKGASSVQETIDGMSKMRSQIQATSKRIKRLGESSQQIGEIVALINDLSDQTNVLSVNASIQAAMAGDAGRGFSVVVDEVQQLAERSSQGARQITDILKHIRSDTSSAVKSMEEATQGVVESTRLADQAGSALVEIQNVSEHLTQLITEISKKAHTHSDSALNASKDMALVKDITVNAAANTREVANMIERLSELAKELQKSVSRFKLPDTDVT